MLRFINITTLLIFTSCIEFDDRSSLPSENSSKKLMNIIVEENFNYETQKEVLINILNDEDASYILYEIDPLKQKSGVISRFTSSGSTKIKVSLKNESKKLLLVASSSKGTSYYYSKITMSEALFNLNSY